MKDTKKIKQITPSYEIRSLTKVKELLKTKLDIDSDEKEVKHFATDDSINNIIKKIGSQEQAKKALAYLVNTYRVLNFKLFDELLNSPDFGSKLKTNKKQVSTSFDEDKKFDNIFNIKGLKFDKTRLISLIKGLIKKAGL